MHMERMVHIRFVDDFPKFDLSDFRDFVYAAHVEAGSVDQELHLHAVGRHRHVGVIHALHRHVTMVHTAHGFRQHKTTRDNRILKSFDGA